MGTDDRNDGAEQALGKLFDLSTALTELVNQGAGERGISPSRGRVLWVLRRAGSSPMRELAEALAVSPRTVTGLVDGLESDGWIRRVPHPKDRRITIIELSERGEATCAELEQAYKGWAVRLFDGISKADQSKLISILDRLNGRFHSDPELAATVGNQPASELPGRPR